MTPHEPRRSVVQWLGESLQLDTDLCGSTRGEDFGSWIDDHMEFLRVTQAKG